MKFFKRLLNFFSRKPQEQQLLSYNISELSTSMDRMSEQLYHCRSESATKLLIKVVDTARNIQLLEVSRVKPDSSGLAHHLGRLQALTDLSAYLTHSLDADVFAERRKDPEKKAKLLIRRAEKSSAVV